MCSLEFPDLETLHQDYAERGLTVIGINPGGLESEETTESLERFVEQTNVTFPVGRELSDSLGQYRVGRQISPLPIDTIIDADGVIRYLNFQFDEEAMRAAIEDVLP